MPENEARAWWVDVQHVRESIERRRGDAGASTALAEPPAAVEPPSATQYSSSTATAIDTGSTAPAGRTAWIDLGAPGTHEQSPDAAWLDAPPRRGRRFERAAADEPPIPRLADLDWPPAPPGGGTRRFGRSARDERAGSTAARDEPPGPRRRATRAADADRAAARGRRAPAYRDRPWSNAHHSDRAPAGHGDAAPVPGARARTTTAPAADVVLDREFGAPLTPPTRRTVQITGRTVAAPALPRLVEVERRRPSRRPVERVGPRPDRIALYAVLLGFFLILVAATSAHT